jgi:hypothetical protein
MACSKVKKTTALSGDEVKLIFTGGTSADTQVNGKTVLVTPGQVVAFPVEHRDMKLKEGCWKEAEKPRAEKPKAVKSTSEPKEASGKDVT